MKITPNKYESESMQHRLSSIHNSVLQKQSLGKINLRIKKNNLKQVLMRYSFFLKKPTVKGLIQATIH